MAKTYPKSIGIATACKPKIIFKILCTRKFKVTLFKDHRLLISQKMNIFVFGELFMVQFNVWRRISQKQMPCMS